MAISGAAVAYSAIGGVVLYSGIKGSSLSDTAKAVLKGNLTVTDTQPVNFGSGGSGSSPGGGTSGASGAVASGSAAAAQAYAKSQMSKRGWTDQDFSNLVSLWTRESGWSNTADTRVTHAGGDNASSAVFAYGIAQARPYSKMPKAGWPPDKGGSADAQVQIDWGLEYIAATYHSPTFAEAHEQQNGWY